MVSMSAIAFDHLPDNYLINTPRRRAFQSKSFFYRLAHPVKKKVVDYEFYTTLLEYFDRTFQINNLMQADRVWDFILSSRNIKWRKGENLTVSTFKRIYKAFEEAIVHKGPGVNFSLDGEDDIHTVSEYLFTRQEGVSFSCKTLMKILFSADEKFLVSFRARLEEALKVGLETFKMGKVGEEAFRGFVFNIVALLPYTYPKEGETFKIPCKVDEAWKVITYTVDKKFAMSPSWFSSPIPIYGLLAEEAPPVLTCMGTTYPSGEGFLAAILADFTPFFSVGHVASMYGKSAVREWLKDKQNVRVTGMSMGGALSLHLSRYHTAAISEVYAFNPPGLYPWNWRGVNHSHIQFHIYSNANDVVSTMGVFPEGENVNVYRLLIDLPENFLSSHSRVYPASEKVIMIRTSAAYENKRVERILLTILHFTFSSLVFFTVLPLHLIFRICQFIYQLITSVCYNNAENKGETDYAELLRSNTERTQHSLSESPVKA